jgi:hypothetical protein
VLVGWRGMRKNFEPALASTGVVEAKAFQDRQCLRLVGMASYGQTWLGVGGHWLPTWLPEIPLA